MSPPEHLEMVYQVLPLALYGSNGFGGAPIWAFTKDSRFSCFAKLPRCENHLCVIYTHRRETGYSQVQEKLVVHLGYRQILLGTRRGDQSSVRQVGPSNGQPRCLIILCLARAANSYWEHDKNRELCITVVAVCTTLVHPGGIKHW